MPFSSYHQSTLARSALITSDLLSRKIFGYLQHTRTICSVWQRKQGRSQIYWIVIALVHCLGGLLLRFLSILSTGHLNPLKSIGVIVSSIRFKVSNALERSIDTIPVILYWSSSFLHCSARISRTVSVPWFFLYANTCSKKYLQNRDWFLNEF